MRTSESTGAVCYTGAAPQSVRPPFQPSSITMKKSFKGPPVNLAIALQAAMAKHKAGKLEAAVQHYRVILQVAPKHPDVMHFLGVALHQLGNLSEAADFIQAALALTPDHADVHNNLGNVYKELGELEKAEQAYRKALSLRPTLWQTQNNLGVLLASQGNYADAIATYQACLAQAPEFAECWHNLGNAYKKTQALEDALSAYRQAILLAPYSTNAYLNLGSALASVKRFDEALLVYQQWQKIEPDNPVVAHMIAAYAGASAPTRASDGYVQQTFDSFADTFDAVLQDLQYHAPERASQLLARLQTPANATRQVLDAGCGTGLCGKYLRPYAQHLRGVDLSQGMLAKAAQRQLYDQLDQGELTAYLATQSQAFDLIVSCDTLIYFGALDAVLHGFASALRQGGRLIFSVEKLDTAESYHLHPHGRYSHSAAYLREMVSNAGLTVLALEEIVLRLESENPVAGYLLAASKA